MVFLKIELLSTFTLINKNMQDTFTFYLISQGKSKFGGKSKNFHQSAHHCWGVLPLHVIDKQDACVLFNSIIF